MKLLKDEKTDLRGWSIFSNLERPDGALVMRDTIDSVIKGVRFQIVPIMDEDRISHHKFTFEMWTYKARGAIEHQTFLSFNLKNRHRYDTRIAKYMSDLRVFNCHQRENEDGVVNALKCAASIIEHVNFNEHFDVCHMLQAFKLIEREQDSMFLRVGSGKYIENSCC